MDWRVSEWIRGSKSLLGPAAVAQTSRAGPSCFMVSAALWGVSYNLPVSGRLSVILHVNRYSNPDSGTFASAFNHPGNLTPVPAKVAVWMA